MASDCLKAYDNNMDSNMEFVTQAHVFNTLNKLRITSFNVRL